MLNYIYIFNHFLIMPVSFLFLSFKKLKYLIYAFILLAISGILNLVLYFHLDIEKNFDPVLTNFIITVFFIFIATRIYENRENLESYNYLRKTILAGFGLYYLFEHIPFLRGLIILIVALISVLLAQIIGFKCYISGIDYAGYNILLQTSLNIIGGNILEVNVPVSETNINIVLGCTGLREILLLYFLIKFSNSKDLSKKIKKSTFLVGASVIFFVNIIRNVVVIYFTGYKNLPFELTHHTIGSILIFLALLFVTLFTLFRIPQINRHIENIFGLKKI